MLLRGDVMTKINYNVRTQHIRVLLYKLENALKKSHGIAPEYASALSEISSLLNVLDCPDTDTWKFFGSVERASSAVDGCPNPDIAELFESTDIADYLREAGLDLTDEQVEYLDN
jgi:hypothetical protein